MRNCRRQPVVPRTPRALSKRLRSAWPAHASQGTRRAEGYPGGRGCILRPSDLFSQTVLVGGFDHRGHLDRGGIVEGVVPG